MMHVHENKSFWKGINVFLMYCFLLLDLYVCVVLGGGGGGNALQVT